MTFPSPLDVGLPDKFHGGWRDGQERIIQDSLSSPRRFTAQSVPTGGGKTICYITSAIMHGGRAIILTGTKGLQDQIEREFGDIVVMMKGQSAYKCRINFQSCQHGPCHWGYGCALKEKGCLYYDQIKKGKEAQIVVTNYSFWLANPQNPLGDFDYMICDESHDSAEYLLDSQSVSFSKREVEQYLPMLVSDSNMGVAIEWVRILGGLVSEKAKRLKNSGDTESPEAVNTLNLGTRVNRLLEKVDGVNWVVEREDGRLSFDPIWPSTMAEHYLFRNIGKVLMTSATLSTKTMDLLGLYPKDFLFTNYPSKFHKIRRPVIYVPTVRMDFRLSNAGMSQWITMMDNIIRDRINKKGIIHTVSYDRCKRVMNISNNNQYMVTHDTKGTRDAVERFKRRSEPCILVSPSMVTGWDFPDDQCRWQILGKIPFPDARSKVMQARAKIDPDYGCYLAMQNVIQACGRGMRSPSDYCETFIIDDHWAWFQDKYKGLMPVYFRESLKMCRTIPTPIWEGKGDMERMSR